MPATATGEEKCRDRFRGRTDHSARGDIERPVRAFRDSGQANADCCGAGDSADLGMISSKSARYGSGACHMAGGKRLLVLIVGTGSIGFIAAFIQGHVGTSAVNETLDQAFRDVSGCNRREHRKARVSKTPVA